jgi:hypothetical protein
MKRHVLIGATAMALVLGGQAFAQSVAVEIAPARHRQGAYFRRRDASGRRRTSDRALRLGPLGEQISLRLFGQQCVFRRSGKPKGRNDYRLTV